MSSEQPEELPETKTRKASESRFEKQWHYRPAVPLATSPLFQFPFNLKSIFLWFSNRWFVFGRKSVVSSPGSDNVEFLPTGLDKTHTLEIGWVGMMFVRNILLIGLVGGGLHYILFYRRHQGKKLRFDARELKSNSANHTFKNQLFDNIFWTLTSGVIFWTAFEVLMLWAMANNYIPAMLWREHPILFVLWLLLTPIWISFHFYWVHRLLHWPPMYKIVHSLQSSKYQYWPLVGSVYASY